MSRFGPDPGEWERGPDGGYSAKITPPGERYGRAVHVWPVNGRKWMAATIGIEARPAGPFPTKTAAQQAAAELVS